VSDLYIPLIRPPILLQDNTVGGPNKCGNIWIAHRHMNVEIGTVRPRLSFLGIHKSKFLCSAYKLDPDDPYRLEPELKTLGGGGGVDVQQHDDEPGEAGDHQGHRLRGGRGAAGKINNE
jgi:hypothetical protein